MEKILLAIDSSNIDPNALDFACQLTRLTRSKLTGVLIEEPVEEEAEVSIPSSQVAYVESILKRYGYPGENTVNTREENIQLFKDKTEEAGIKAVLETHCEVTASCISRRTRFADILVVDAATSFAGFNETVPSSFVKEVLHNAECPVIISPETFNGIDNLVFCYDGSKSSVFAIKQFTYLFPELKDKRAKVIYLGKSDEFLEEDREAIVDWLRYHYSDVEFISLGNDVQQAFFHYLTEKKNDFVIMGAYGRGLLASFFSRSGQPLISLPVFIAHY